MKKKLKQFYDMVEDIDTAMFTTRRRDGHLVSRPMANQAAANGADLWFVTSKDTSKIEDLEYDPQVVTKAEAGEKASRRKPAKAK